MARHTDASAAPRVPLTKERVLRAAIDLADAGGIEALSMRRLAKELGVEAMSLYNHVANKDAILDGIIDAVVGEIELPPAGADWRAAIRQSAISARNVFVRHRWASSLQMSRPSAGPARLRHMDWMLRTLREAGFSKELTYDALHILDSHILGFTLLHLSVPSSAEAMRGMASTFLQQLASDQYPYLTEHIRQHMEPYHGEEGGFELGLDLILDGLERVRDATSGRSAGR